MQPFFLFPCAGFLCRCRNFLCAIILLFPVVFFNGARAENISATIADQTLRYAASYGGKNAGEIVIDIRTADDGYVVTSTAEPSWLTALFVKSHVMTTHFTRELGQVVLERGYERTVKRNGKVHEHDFRVNRAGARIEFSNGKHHAIATDHRLEAVEFPLLLMLRRIDEIEDTLAYEVSTKRSREYRYGAPLAEMVTVPAGTFASWRIRRHRTNQPDHTVTVWLRKPHDTQNREAHIPLKIIVSKRGNTSSLTLVSQSLATNLTQVGE